MDLLSTIEEEMEAENHQSLNELQLLDLMRAGEESAFKELYNRYWYDMYSKAYHLICDEDGAKDIVQELFIDLWNQRQKKEIESLNSYLSQAIKFRCFMALRKRYTSKKHLDRISLSKKNCAYDTEEAINLSQLELQLKSSMAKLPAKCRQVFELSRFEHFSNEQIARRMNISVKTVENQMTKALKILRSYLKDLMILVLFSLFF